MRGLGHWVTRVWVPEEEFFFGWRKTETEVGVALGKGGGGEPTRGQR